MMLQLAVARTIRVMLDGMRLRAKKVVTPSSS